MKTTLFRFAAPIMSLFFLTGCSGTEEKSELLSLLGVDEKIVDTNQDTENIYDAITLLKRGEAFYVKEEYIEAISEFERFLLLHPFHRMAAFSQFKLAMSYFQQLNTIDRDPGPMINAMTTFERILSQYPQSLYVEEAKEKIAKLELRTLKHEFLVGHFYYRTETYPAAIARFNKILRKNPDETLLEKTLYFLGLSHFESGDIASATTTFQNFLEKYPQSEFRKKIIKIQAKFENASPVS